MKFIVFCGRMYWKYNVGSNELLKLSDYNNIHCIGIGGIGLSALAEILLERGHRVSGSDSKESEITERLIKKGAYVFLGQRGKNVDGADLVVYSAAVSNDNPEIQRAEELNIPIVTRAELLGALMDEYEVSIAVSGTHGKTTTTSMISLILENAKNDPTILIGGNLSQIGGNVKMGRSEYCISEACEYMDSFLSLRPTIEIILNIDSDHLDYFKDIDHIVNSFKEFAKRIKEGGKLIAYEANPFVSTVLKDYPQAITFGYSENCTYAAKDIVFNSQGMPEFKVFFKNEELCKIELSIPGEHNILNALAATACCHSLGVETKYIVDTLKEFKGTQRRFDVIGVTSEGIKVVDDYAHHPTEIKATLAAAKNLPSADMWCLFQPHTYTRTRALFNEFTGAFEDADKIILAEIYAAREKNIHKISSKELVAEIKKLYPGKEVYYFKEFDEIASFVLNNAQKDDLVITMGAGDIYKVAELILEKDREKSRY